MKDIIIPEGLGEGDTFVENGIRFTIKNGDLTVRDLDLGEYLYVAEGDTPEAAKKKAAKARYLITKNIDDLRQFGLVHSVSEPYVSGKGRTDDATVHYLTEDPLYYLVPMTRTKKGRELRILMTHVFIAWRKGSIAAIAREPKPTLKAPSTVPDPRQIVPLTPASPQLESIEPYDDQRLSAEMKEARRSRRPPEPEQIVTDETGQLRIRYSMLAYLIDEDLTETYY